MTLDESLLTGEADGIRKGEGDRGALGLLLHLRLGPLPGRRGARGELRRQARRRGARLPPPALAAAGRGQPGDPRLDLRDAAAGGAPAVHAQLRSIDLDEAAQTATAGPGDADPRGPGAADERHLRGRRGAAGRRDTLVQQISATESLAAVDTICVDKTGTLTDGELRLLGVEFAEGVDAGDRRRGAGPLRRQRRRPQPHPGDDRRALPGRGRSGSAPRSPSPRSGSGAALRSAGAGDHLRAGRARRPRRGRGAELPPGWPASSSRRPRPGRRVVAFGESGGGAAGRPRQRRRRRG